VFCGSNRLLPDGLPRPPSVLPVVVLLMPPQLLVVSTSRWRRGHKRVHEGEGSEPLRPPLAVRAMAEICERALRWDAWFTLHEAIQALHDRLFAIDYMEQRLKHFELQPYQSVNASIVGRN